MSYTVGNWTVASLTTDTISSPKSLSVPDLSYASDFTVAAKTQTEQRLSNKTGSSLLPVETLRYGRRDVNNVYNILPVPDAQQCNAKAGVLLTTEVRYLLKATNSVSGQEVLLPMRGWLNLTVPTVDLVTPAALQQLLMRTLATAFATGSSDGSLVTSVARGDLDPTS